MTMEATEGIKKHGFLKNDTPFLEQNRKEFQGVPRKSSEKKVRIPIFLKFAAPSALLIFLVTSGISFFVLEKQNEQYMEQLVSQGTRMTRIIANNAPDKLLSDEQLSLFQLVLDVAEDDQVIHAVITDENNIVKAHSQVENVNDVYFPPRDMNLLKENGDVKISSFSSDGEECLFFEKIITYQKLPIGNVYLGVSKKKILQSLRNAKIYILILTLVIVMMSIPLSLGLSIYFSKPIKELSESAVAYEQGDFEHQVNINRNDTLGDLGSAFNKMALGLAMKEKIKDSFGRYVTPEIVDLVLENRDNQWMKAAKVEATVLFVDIRGFTSLAEELEPETIAEILNEHFTKITDIVIKNGGHLNKFIGDEAMAIFGVPHSDPEHASAALVTAVEIQKEISEHHNYLSLKIPIRVGIGVNSGIVVAGNLGSQKKMEYTIIGDEVNVASRLTSHASAGEILISRRTLELTNDQDEFIIERKKDLLVKGKKKQVSVYNVLYERG